ncbi:MAG: phosphotransferase [Gammaproteobacteria bacterium]
MTETDRLIDLKTWLATLPGFANCSLEPASADASFRRYFRVWKNEGVQKNGQTYIVMDAPPDKENSQPFINIANAFRDIGLNTPEILQQDLAQGFLLLSDLGQQVYLSALNDDSVEHLYANAMGALATLQSSGQAAGLPEYDHDLLMSEMALFPDWLLTQHCQIQLTDAQCESLHVAFELLAKNALQQPQVCVHRDYHSRNLMVYPSHNPGILDFQDAVVGAFTYDLVSLLRDCYIAWPQEKVIDWALGYRALADESGIIPAGDISEQQFLRWFDLMGVQRHLKAAGIFARLKHRDRKDGYLKDIPRTLNYVIEVSRRYPELAELGELASTVRIGQLAV